MHLLIVASDHFASEHKKKKRNAVNKEGQRLKRHFWCSWSVVRSHNQRVLAIDSQWSLPLARKNARGVFYVWIVLEVRPCKDISMLALVLG